MDGENLLNFLNYQ